MKFKNYVSTFRIESLFPIGYFQFAFTFILYNQTIIYLWYIYVCAFIYMCV